MMFFICFCVILKLVVRPTFGHEQGFKLTSKIGWGSQFAIEKYNFFILFLCMYNVYSMLPQNFWPGEDSNDFLKYHVYIFFYKYTKTHTYYRHTHINKYKYYTQTLVEIEHTTPVAESKATTICTNGLVIGLPKVEKNVYAVFIPGHGCSGDNWFCDTGKRLMPTTSTC